MVFSQKNNSCKSCRFFVPGADVSRDGAQNQWLTGTGQCRSLPPSRAEGSRGTIQWDFPLVREEWFCGAHEAKSEDLEQGTCGECRFFDGAQYCRLKPPTHNQGNYDRSTAMFTITKDSLWCGRLGKR